MAIYGDGKHNENMEHIDKKDYDFYVDRKITTWVREYHTIKADSHEAAKKEMIEAFHDNLCSETFKEQETLFDTEELMEPGDNGGQATIELLDNNEMFPTTIATNVDEVCDHDWIGLNNNSSYSSEEICRKCREKRTT